MNKLGSLLLGMFVVLPVYAQDQPAADAAAPVEAAPADTPPADAAPADATATEAPAADTAASDAAPAADAAPADAAASTDAAPAGDTPPADTAASDAAPAADAAATEGAPADAAAAGDTPADATASTDAAATDAAATDAAATDAAAPADGEAAPADATAEAAPAEAAPEEERKPWQLYAGYDYAQANFLASSPDSPSTPNKANQFSEDSLHGNFHQIRAGVRIFDVIGIEAHYGIKAGNGDKPDSMGVKNNMGLYFVPTGTLFDVVEISALVGYASSKLEHNGKTLSIHGSSYGANLEVPLRPLLGEWMPDIRVGGGFMVYHHDRESRVYGSHFGFRYDFKV